jgi:FkbM family methyltransferase
VAKKRWLRKLIEKGPVLVEHYAHAAEVRVFLLRELLRARSQGIAVPRWLFHQALRQPGATEYLVSFLRFIRPDVRLRLIDVGANTGFWSADFLRLFPDTFVTAIEPIPAAATLLRKRFSGDSRVSIINAAVTPASGPVEMTQATESTLSSIHAYSSFLERPDVEGTRIQVEAVRLDDVEIPGDDRTIILKLDTQGHEFHALTTGKNILQRVSVAIIEVSFVEEYVSVAPSFGSCVAFLREADLHPLIFQDFGRALSPYAFERDVIFAKSTLLANILGY